ncbi:phosphoglycerate dehydrogenase-like oxidoreductase [Pseudomonas sp. GM21]|uniref:C-terminal binding protein n=1 Tax=Pseudomonas sp. GM21 TaxID=1144325 RepID=UPI000272590F|nr:C-terminal binding protein [Pseudomonas sp. GM21]EJM22919.1 phosphoglycerate dehydrogenase-like oxidoreductase [Pseudomonas sp. GM21]
MNSTHTRTVLLTDFAWPDDSVERQIIEKAGFTLVSGPANPAPAVVIEDLVRKHQPEAILTCWAQVSEAAIEAATNLKIVARLGVGLDNIAVDQATRNGIWVTNVPDYCVEEVSDHAVGLALAWTRGLVSFDREVSQGRWNPAGAALRRLKTLTVGIVGYGRIGRRTAQKLQAFNPRLLAFDPYPSKESGVAFVELDELMRQADVVIVHAPLTSTTHHLINQERLDLLKPGSFLINVSRGGVVDTDAVIRALESGQLSGAGLDVLEHEPQVPTKLLHHPGVIITPHVAFSSDASLVELRQRASEEVVRVLLGEQPQQARNQL